jgi:ABC-type transport system involved in cytochrome bd biosynthesis fused ATPase/permease subunit
MDSFINIDNAAYEELIKLLKSHPEYNCAALKLTKVCCSRSSVDVLLDEIGEQESAIKFKDLQVKYDDSVAKAFSRVELKYENNTFMIKCTPVNNSSCTGCRKSCSHHSCK